MGASMMLVRGRLDIRPSTFELDHVVSIVFIDSAARGNGNGLT